MKKISKLALTVLITIPFVACNSSSTQLPDIHSSMVISEVSSKPYNSDSSIAFSQNNSSEILSSSSSPISEIESDSSTINDEQATISAPASKNETMGQKNAVSSAKSYISFSTFSYQGLIEQLEYEGFTHDQAIYAVEANGY